MQHLTLKEYKDLLMEWNQHVVPSHRRSTRELAKLSSNGKRLLKGMSFSIPADCRLNVDPDKSDNEPSCADDPVDPVPELLVTKPVLDTDSQQGGERPNAGADSTSDSGSETCSSGFSETGETWRQNAATRNRNAELPTTNEKMFFVIADGTKIPDCCRDFLARGKCAAGNVDRCAKGRHITLAQYQEEKDYLNKRLA